MQRLKFNVRQAVEKGPPASLRSIASLQRISKYASAHRFLARLASGPFWTAWNQGFSKPVEVETGEAT
jgi:hypothetical protein